MKISLRALKPVLLFVIVLLPILESCRKNNLPADRSIKGHEYVIERIDTSSVITFLFFEIYHDSINSTNHIKLADRRDVTGKVKGGYDESPVFFMPCLIIDYYENDRLIHQSKMEHPLFRHVEHFGENEMGWHTIISQTAEFSLRCQKTAGNNKKIIISEKFDDEKNNELITINL